MRAPGSGSHDRRRLARSPEAIVRPGLNAGALHTPSLGGQGEKYLTERWQIGVAYRRLTVDHFSFGTARRERGKGRNSPARYAALHKERSRGAWLIAFA